MVREVPYGSVWTIVHRLPDGISVNWQEIAEGRSLLEGKRECVFGPQADA